MKERERERESLKDNKRGRHYYYYYWPTSLPSMAGASVRYSGQHWIW